MLARQGRHPLRDGGRPGDSGRPRRHHPGHLLRHLRVRPAPVRRLRAGHEVRRRDGPRDDGRGRRRRQGQHQAEGRRPRRGALHHQLRRVRLLQARAVLRLRTVQPERRRTGQADRLSDRGPVRLHPHVWRLPRRPGGISARPLCRRRADQGAERPDRRPGPVPVRHLPDRLDGGREREHPARPDRPGLRLRPGRPVRHPQRLHDGRRTRHRRRPGRGAAAPGAEAAGAETIDFSPSRASCRTRSWP